MDRNITFKQIRLVFSDLSRLRSFSRNLTNQNLEITKSTSVLICDCTDEEIEKAVHEYGAIVFKQTMDNTHPAS